MSSMFFKLGPDDDSIIILYPEWDYENGLKKLEKKHRLQNADLYVYKTGEYEEIEIKCKYFPLSDAAIINSWWQSNTELLYYQREKDFRDWSFQDTTEGWATYVTSGTVATSDNGILFVYTNSQFGQVYTNFQSSSYQGSENYIITARVKLNGLSWLGKLYWGVNGANSHSTNDSYYITTSADTSVYSDYTIVQWDMRSVDLGGDDYLSNEITRLDIWFSNAESGSMEIDYIDAGFRYSSVSSVMIRNSKKPFAKYQEPYADYMQGTIKLEGY